MISFKKNTVSVILYDNYLFIRGEEANKNVGYKIPKSSFQNVSLEIDKIEKMNTEELLRYFKENNLVYEKVQFF